MNTKKTRLRRAFFVRHESHRRLILKVGAIFLVLVVVSGTLFYVLAQKELAAEYFRAHSQVRSTMEMLLPWLMSVSLLGIAAALVLTAAYTRRIAGPLLRLTMELERLAKGDLSNRVTLRQGDELHEIAARLNDFTSFVATRLQEINREVDELQKLTKQFQNQDSKALPAELTSLLAEFRETLSGLESARSKFRL